MNPSFDIPGCSNFFYEGSEERENDADIKISWFQEKMDSYVAKRVVTNYQVYELRQQFPQKDSTQRKEKKCSDGAIGEKNSNYFDSKEETNKDFHDYLKRLFTLGSTLNTLNPSQPRHIVNPLHCGLLIKNQQEERPSSRHELVELVELVESEDKSDKSSCEICDSSADSAEIVPLATLELFIKNAMDTSLAKFRDEINMAINCKFESLKCLKEDVSSETIANKQIDNSDVPNVPKSNYSSQVSPGTVQPPLNLPPELQTVPSQPDPLSHEEQLDNLAVDEARTENCTVSDLMQPEIPNLIKGCSNKFQSESINIISKSHIETQIGSASNDAKSNFNANKSKANSSNDDFAFSEKCQSLNILSKNTQISILKDELSESNTMSSPDEQTPSSDSTKESKLINGNQTSELKKYNHKLLNDVSKFMFIIFESFRRLKDENNINLKKRKLTKCEINNILCSLKNSGSAFEPYAPSQKPAGDHAKGINSCINIPPQKFEQFFEEISSKDKDSPKEHPIDTPLKIVRSRPIISCVTSHDVVEGSGNGTNIFHPSQYPESSGDSGYPIYRFIKDSNARYKPAAESNDLAMLKKKYLLDLISERENQNLKESEVEDSSDKYKCLIKKKFSTGRSVLRNKRDSKFYCNVTKPKDCAKSRDSLVTFIDFCKKSKCNKGSSNIINMRNRLNKNRSRGVFKSSAKRSDVSLDSTIMSLLDISAQNVNFLFKKTNSSTFSPPQEEKADSGNLLKRLCFINFVWSKKACLIFEEMDKHLINIYNAICLDFVSDDVYKSVIFVAHHLRSCDNKTKSEILKHWIKICNRQQTKEKKSFNLEFIQQLWSQFLIKICHHARPSTIFPTGFFPTLTYPSEENRFLKEQVIQKYAKDILEYISNPKLFK